MRHRQVMEQHLGRKLRPNETVHHKDGNRANNKIENLELWSNRHGKGQRVEDRVAFYLSFLQDHPELLKQLGYKLEPITEGSAAELPYCATYQPSNWII
jgi:hypothetical protein